MKKTLLCFLLAMGAANAQTTLFEDSFETYNDFIITGIGGWTLHDLDLRPTYGFTGVTFANGTNTIKSFQVFNSTTTTAPLTPSATSNWAGRTGVKAMVCFAAVPNATVLTNDDWMISPQITLAASGNMLSFWGKSCDAQFGDERFSVYVSTTGTAVADFTKISDEPDTPSPGDVIYHEYTYDLDAYAGQPIYIAIQCTSADQFGFAVDDFKVTTTLMAVDNFFTRNFAVYPNPATTMLNINSKTNTGMNQVQITDINGRIVRQMEAQGITQAQLNVSDLTSGVYFIKVQSDLGSGTTKFIKS
jgi:hypothetical protein